MERYECNEIQYGRHCCIIYKIWMHGDPQILWLQSMCVFKMHTFKIFQKLIHRKKYLNLKKYDISLELALVRPFFHTNTYKFMSSQDNVKGHVFQKQAWIPLILCFILISYRISFRTLLTFGFGFWVWFNILYVIFKIINLSHILEDLAEILIKTIVLKL